MPGQYGNFSYGGAQPRRPRDIDRADRRPPEPETPAESDVFGTGFALNTAADPGHDFDLVVDPRAGSIRPSTGLQHFNGDLSAKVATVSEQLIGTLRTPEEVSDFRTDVIELLNREDRVQRVDSVRAFAAKDGTGAVVLDITITATDGTRHTDQIPVPTDTPPGVADPLAALP